MTPLPSTPSGKLSIPLKLCLFNLSKYLKEPLFAAEFMAKGGIELLVRLILDGPSTSSRLSYMGSSSHDAGTDPEIEPLKGNSLAVSVVLTTLSR
jgi:hypothetical protein